jgi:transcriptional regulator with XRE-family HTH domain
MSVITILEVERRRRGLSATELARRMQVAKSTISAIERRRRAPSSRFKARAAAVLGIDVGDLWPHFFTLVRDVGDQSRLRAGDKLIAFSSRCAARSVASDLRKLAGVAVTVRGPFPAEALAAEEEVFPSELTAHLVLDPQDDALIEIARWLNGERGR